MVLQARSGDLKIESKEGLVTVAEQSIGLVTRSEGSSVEERLEEWSEWSLCSNPCSMGKLNAYSFVYNIMSCIIAIILDYIELQVDGLNGVTILRDNSECGGKLYPCFENLIFGSIKTEINAHLLEIDAQEDY